MTSKITPVGALAIAGILRNQGLATPANLITANTVFTTTQISGAAQTRLQTGDANVIAALTANVPAFLTGIVPIQWRTSIPAGVAFNVNNAVDTVTTTGRTLLGNNITRFTEIVSVASDFCGYSYDLAGSLTGIKRQENVGINYASIAGQVTGGVAEQFGNTIIGTAAWLTFTSNLNNIGSLINAADLPDCFLARNVLNNLANQGQIQAINQSFTAANIADSSSLSSRQIVNVLDQYLTTDDIHEILDACEAQLLSNVTATKFSDLLNLNNYLDPSAQGIVDTGANLAAKIYNLAGINSDRTTFGQWGDVLSGIAVQGNLDLITTTYSNPAAFANAITVGIGNFGTGGSVFGTPTLPDIVGPAADLISSSQTYSNVITTINQLQTTVLADTLGQNLLSAISTGTSANIITAGTAVSTATGNLGLAVQRGNQLFESLFTAVNQVKRNLIASEITDSTGNIPSDLTGTATSVRGFINNNYQYYLADRDTGLASGAVIAAMATADVYGQSILASQAESRNIELLRSVGAVTESDAAIDATALGLALSASSANIAAAETLSANANLSYSISTVSTLSYGEVYDLPIVISASYEPSAEIYLPDNRLQFTHLATPDFVTIEFDIADTETRNFWFRATGDLVVDNFTANVIQSTASYSSRRFRLALRTTTNVPPSITTILSFRIELYLTANADSRPIWNSADIKIIPYGLTGSVETGI